MEQRIYHGKIISQNLAENLISQFNRGNYQVQQIGSGDKIAVQIATSNFSRSGGQTALSIYLQNVEDGVSVSMGQQGWLGVAASLGYTAFSAIRSPFKLLERLDDIAQDIESLQLVEMVWNVIDQTAKSMGAGFELSERLRRSVCTYCMTANVVGSASCVACGAPMGENQPITCKTCGFIVGADEITCPNCGSSLTPINTIKN